MTIEIPLTKGYVAIVDDEDRDLFLIRWYIISEQQNTGYAARTNNTGIGSRTCFMHRIIMERILNRPLLKNEYVDHIDSNGLNNCRLNLRLATKQQNSQNMRKRKNNTTGFKGVSYRKINRKYQAQISVNGKIIYLGGYETPEEAHNAYCAAAEKYFGEFWRAE